MPKDTKILLSQQHYVDLLNKEFFKRKLEIEQLVFEVFGNISVAIKPLISEIVGHPIESKISKGERFLDSPYYVLDIPKIQTIENLLLCRIVVSWGRGIMIYIIGIGSYKNQVKKLEKIMLSCYNSLWEMDYEKQEKCIDDDYWKVVGLEPFVLLNEPELLIQKIKNYLSVISQSE